MVAQRVEARLVDVGLAGDVGGEAAHQLDFAADVAFQPILDQIEFDERLGPGAGERELLLLPVGDDAQEDRDHGGDRRWRESRAAQRIEEARAGSRDDILADRREDPAPTEMTMRKGLEPLLKAIDDAAVESPRRLTGS